MTSTVKSKSGLPAPSLDTLLATAARIFYERGYSSATLELIAQEMGTTRDAIEVHVKTTEDIFSKLVDKSFKLLLKIIDDARKESTGKKALQHFLRKYLEVIHGYEAASVYFLITRQISVAERKRRREFTEKFFCEVATLVARAIEDGTIRSCNARATAEIVLFAFHGTLFSIRPGETQNWQALADSILETYLEGLGPTHSRRKLPGPPVVH